MKKYNFTEMKHFDKEVKHGGETKISFWFTDEDRKEACITYGTYNNIASAEGYTSFMTVEHRITFKLDDEKEYYVNKLESGLKKELKRQEDDDKYGRDLLPLFKDNSTISAIFEKVSEKLYGEVSKVKEIFIMDITKENPLFDSKELLKLCAEDKYYATISLEDFRSKNIRIWYNLRGLGGVGIGIPVNLYPTETLIERIVKAVSKFEKDNDIDIIPRFFNSFTSKKFDRNIEILKRLTNYTKDTNITSIELNPMTVKNVFPDDIFVTIPIDPNVFYLDIRVTREKEGKENTEGYILMRERINDENFIHHSLTTCPYKVTLYRYEHGKKVNPEDIYIKLLPLKGDIEEITISRQNYFRSSNSLSFRKVSFELCKYLDKDVSLLVNFEYHVANILGLIYEDKIIKPYDSVYLDKLNEDQLHNVYEPFIEEVITAFKGEYDEDIKNYGRFSNKDQIKASAVYNFRNLLSELDDRLCEHIVVSKADCQLITDCEVFNGPAEYNTIEVKFYKDLNKSLTQITSLRDSLTFMIHLNTKSGKTLVRVMEVLLTKDGPVVSSITSNKKYTDTKKFSSVQFNIQDLLGEYLYGLLTFLGKLLYIYELLDNDVRRGVQFLNTTDDEETTESVAKISYHEVEGTYIKYLKELRYNKEPEEEFVDEEELDEEEF